MRQRVNFRGRVQGVGFRATARGVARAHAVTGWVRNEPDGSVLLEVQGAGEVVDRYLTELRGVMGRNIREAEEIRIPDVVDEEGFEVRY